MQESRRFTRHTASIPIEVRPSEGAPWSLPGIHDVSQGGLAFRSSREAPLGTTLSVHIPAVRPAFQSLARVVWCLPVENVFDVGVEFIECDDEFRARMVEQVCRIWEYRRHVQADEGRTLTVPEAAEEWIAKHGAAFPDPAPAR
jgi:hypothetical protein